MKVCQRTVALKQPQKNGPPIIQRGQARKRDLSTFDLNDEPDVSIEYPGVTFKPPAKLMKGDQKYLSDISMKISSDSEDSSPEQSFFRTPSKWKVSNRASNSYKIGAMKLV